MNRYEFAGGTAIVTGAASGIGEALARKLASLGSSLVLVDRDAARLDILVHSLAQQNRDVQIEAAVVDLADGAATDALGARLAADHPETTLLINCAGVALGGTFAQVTLDEFNWLIDINFRAVVTLTHHLLPVLRNNPGAHLANVSSVFGFIAPPGQAAYVSSKFAIRGLTEAIRTESRGRDLGVTCIHPGGIRTQIAANARVGSGVTGSDVARSRANFDRVLTIPASVAADVILNGIRRRKPRVLIGASAKIPDVVARIAPGHTMDILARFVS